MTHEIDIIWMEENILLHKLYDQDAKEVKELFTVHHYEMGDEIITEGEPGEGLKILRSGCVAISCKADGQIIDLSELKECALFGEMSFFSGHNATATVTARRNCTVYELTRGNYCKLLVTNPTLLMSLLTHMVNYSSKVIQEMNREKIRLLRLDSDPSKSYQRPI